MTVPESVEPLLTVADVARILNVPRSFVYSKAEAGELPSLKISKYVRFRSSDIAAYLVAQQRGAGAK